MAVDGESPTENIVMMQDKNATDDEEPGRNSGIIHSDSDSDDDGEKENKEKGMKKNASDDDHVAGEDLLSSDDEEEAFQKNSKRNVSHSRKLIISDQSEEEKEEIEPDEELLDIPPSNSNHAKFSTSVVPGRVLDPDIYGDDGDSDEDVGKRNNKKTYERSNNSSGMSSDEDREERASTDKGKKIKKADKIKAQRKASEKARAKTLQTITSETQKLVREKRISLPYHKPKQLTLDQFLKKRNQAKSRVFSTIAEQPATLGTMLNSLVKIQEDILPVIAKAEEEKVAEDQIIKDVKAVEDNIGLDEDDGEEEEEVLERPNVTGEYQPPKEKVGGWLEKDVGIGEDLPMTEDEVPTTSSAVDQVSKEEPLTEDNVQTPATTAEKCEKDLLPTPSEQRLSTTTCEKDLPSTVGTGPVVSTVEKSSDPVTVSSSESEAIVVDLAEEDMVEQKDKVAEQDTKAQISDQSLLEGEAELASFLEEMRPKPKRLTLAERLKAMPGFEKLASAKPRIGGGQVPSSGVIDLDDFKKPSRKDAKKEKNIQTLMDRFLKHSGLGYENNSSSKEQHHIIHVNTMEKDSQGAVQDVKTDEFDYVTNSVEKEDLLDMIVKPKHTVSPSGRREAVPGEKMVRLREALKERIRKTKTKAYEDRLQEAEANKKLEEENASEEEEIMEDEDIEISDSEEDEELLEEDDMPKKKKKKKTKSAFVNSEADEEKDDGDDDDDEDEESSEESDDDDDEHEVEVSETDGKIKDTDDTAPEISQKKKICRQIIYSDDEDDETVADHNSTKETNDFALLTPTQDNKSEEPENSVIAKLVQSSALGSLVPPSTDEDMAELCSGRFPSQAPLTPVESQSDCFGFDEEDETNAHESNVPLEHNESDDDEDDSESLFCKVSSKPSPGPEDAGKEHVSVKTPSISGKDEVEDDIENPSDDVSEVGDEEDIPENEEEEIEDEELEEIEDDDDDEEAALERELQARSLQQADTPKRKSTGLFGKGGRLRRKFFENEAELSGSDEGSGDEDEKGINYYEDEEGDEDELDEDEVKNQIERAHLKQLLDKDDREIRFLQEEYLERGDLEDGKLRVRKFRWTDVDEAWGDDAAMMGDSDGEDGLGNEDEEEIKKRYEEIEKRKWLLEHPEVMEACAEESQKQLLQENTKYLKLGSRNQKKIESFVESSCSMIMNETSCSVPETSFATLVKSQIKANAKMHLLQSEKKQPASLSEPLDTPPTTTLSKASSSKPSFGNFASPDDLTSKIKRGSFLSRGSPTLSRLAQMTKSSDGNGGSIKSNSRNFVFAVVTPPDQQNKQKVPKRPAASNSQGKFLTKKIKIDRSFSSLDDSSKDNSIFKYM